MWSYLEMKAERENVWGAERIVPQDLAHFHRKNGEFLCPNDIHLTTPLSDTYACI